MHGVAQSIGLADLGVVRVHGTDGVRFLQGQLSNDIELLTAERSLLAGYHNPQGRTIALLRLIRIGADDLLAVLPLELAPAVASRLARFILRSKVKISDESAKWRVTGLVGAPAMAAALPLTLHAQRCEKDVVFVCVGVEPRRWLMLTPLDARPSLPESSNESDMTNGAPGILASSGSAAGSSLERHTWRSLDVAAGQPQVYAATTEEFVAQMLNLDALEAIAFHKGCYTGQEVIARAHYRGRVKRRLQRFVTRDAARLAPGESGQLADGRTFKVVEAVQLADGRCDFLAVAPLAVPPLVPGTGGKTGAPESGLPVQGSGLPVQEWPLPYPLPD